MAPRDSTVSANYYALKLASWITDGKYWCGGLSENQVMWLIRRVLGDPEVVARWGVVDVEVEFVAKGKCAQVSPGKFNHMLLPANACTTLIVLHEVAHLLKTTRREAHHGNGFTAIHLMLIELVKPKLLSTMLSCYRAMGVDWDVSKIPVGKTTYLPLLVSCEATEGRHQLETLLTSPFMSETVRLEIRRVLRRKQSIPPVVYAPLPVQIIINTEALLACMNNDDIAELVLAELAVNIKPRVMRRGKIAKS